MAQASATSLIATVTGMGSLESFTMRPAAAAIPKIGLEVLTTTSLSQLLTSCSLLTTLSMAEVVVDQAGLDLLLAHPHIIDVTLLAIAATESRVDSPCSWRALNLAREVDIRTVAYVPLHSLEKPLEACSLLLPSDVPPDQLPQLLLKAATRIAQHRHLFCIDDHDWLRVKDYVSELASGVRVDWQGPVQAAFSPTAQSALFAALEPLSGIGEITGLELRFHYQPSPTGPPPRVQVGGADLEQLDRAWGSRITWDIWFRGISVAPGFFKAFETCFPKLKGLWLENIEVEDEESLVPRIMLFCQRMTRPIRLHLDQEVKE
jgi:hypothetical protein